MGTLERTEEGHRGGKRALDVKGTADVILRKTGTKKEAYVYVVAGVIRQLILGLLWIRRHVPTIHWNELSMALKGEEV